MSKAGLTEQIDRLIAQLTEMRRLAAAVDEVAARPDAMRVPFPLSLTQETILSLLYKRQSIAIESVFLVVYGSSPQSLNKSTASIGAAKGNLCKKLAPYGIEIRTRKGVPGTESQWYMPPESKRRLQKLMQAYETP